MSEKFSHQYKLKKDLPTYPKGWEFGWNGDKFYPYERSKFEFDKGKPSIYLDMNHTGYTVDEMKKTEWFEPHSPEVDFIPNFPDRDRLDDFVELGFELKLVDRVDECRAMRKLFNDEKFEQKLYEFVKTEYNNFYFT